MATSFDGTLNESLRDAMLAMYLHEAVPKDAYIIEQNLVDRIKTPSDLYEYWLLDVLVSQNVPTSPVACAIASLQQLVNSMMLNMEPGYRDNSLSTEQVDTWQTVLNHYPIWAGLQQLQDFPDIYLDPTLRKTKTDSFKQFEADITQAKIQPDTIISALMAYLARFEEIANLNICNGYIDGDDFANSTYYFIARSPAENAYYWRSLDMRQRPAKAAASRAGEAPFKYDKPSPHAWTDWQRANVPISDKVLEHTIRPCWFNNRLFVVWAQVEYPDTEFFSPQAREGTAQETSKPYPLFRLYASYKKYDDSWSTPRVYAEHTCKTPGLIIQTPEEIAANTHTIAVYDHSTSPESLVLMVYSGYRQNADPSGDKDQYDFLRSVRVDKNYKVTPLFPAAGSVLPPFSEGALEQDSNRDHVLLIGHTFASNQKNQGRFQYWLPSSVPVFGSLVHGNPPVDSTLWNFEQLQSNVKTLEKDVDIAYDRKNSNIELNVRLQGSFEHVREENFILFEDDQNTRPVLEIKLTFNETSLHKGSYTLLPGSELIPLDSDFFDRQGGVYLIYVYASRIVHTMILANDGKDRFELPRTAAGQTASLAGKRLAKKGLELAKKNQASFDVARLKPDESYLAVSKNRHHTNAGPFFYQYFVGHPLDVQTSTLPTTFAQIRPLYASGIEPALRKDSWLSYSFSIDQVTHQADGWPVIWPEKQEDIKIPLIYGVLIYEERAAFPPMHLVGGALKTAAITWGAELNTELQIAPSINSLTDPTQGDSPSLGRAQFIDFTGSAIAFSDGELSHKKPLRRDPIRMNTTFVRHLIGLAESSMESLLNWNTQHLPEPPIGGSLGAEPMDFSGGYSLYFLELFLYLPWLVAHRLNQEQQYDDAKRWLAFLFNPARQSNEQGHPGYWQSVPLEEAVWPTQPDPSQAVLYPYDPHRIALSFPVHLRKALYGLYIDIECNQADAAYHELTPDGLAQAKLRYTHLLDMLGPRPDVRQADDWVPVTLDQLSTSINPHLRTFEQQLINAQQSLHKHPPVHVGPAAASPQAPLLCLRAFTATPELSALDNPYLRRPFNPELIRRWERIESRLYNLRHNLNIDGTPLNLPLFASPLDPRTLLSAQQQGLIGPGLNRSLTPQIPHYRFSVMFALAQNAVDGVIQFGTTLLSLIERKEQAQYLELQQRQAWNLARVAVDIQLQLEKVDEANREAMRASLHIVQGRVSYYDKLINDDVSVGERLVGGLLLNARVAETGLPALGAEAEFSKLPPNIFGFAVGGQRMEGVSQVPMYLLQGLSSALHGQAEVLAQHEQFRRRTQEWNLARDQAKLESRHIEMQLKVLEEQHRATHLQLLQAQTALNQAQATHALLLGNQRFSQSQTYDWLNSKFSGFYYSAFNAAQSICQAAEACWQYETCQFDQTFILPGAWNNSYRGLGAGEALKMGLQQMYREYVQHNVRDLEIRKTLSLKDLKARDPDSTLNKSWEEVKAALLNTGSCEFEVTQKMLDDDYDGQNHYLRRIKTISASFPVVLGPYEDIRAILTQSYSKVELLPSVGTNIRENLKANQQIALSHGVNDDGQFQLNFQDERYLPFEYTGAVSRWRLTFPNAPAQRGALNSLTDIIFHLSYTARSGGSMQ
ncbi:neuraminidase-like domain-containing protein [Pseudomonas proteolytica]|uniref:Tc toxin subunit A-related protein n=1 Tax=Pseudomonas proteolytica TaxID=219574 RepID=UPI0014745BE7|nr:neuraminidase-like domain-containing protein [Pseudomonas proteolytica]NMY93428.1 efflux RND transporter periplasmic adaptor subunit [Pseudomonas proteolytica]